MNYTNAFQLEKEPGFKENLEKFSGHWVAILRFWLCDEEQFIRGFLTLYFLEPTTYKALLRELNEETRNKVYLAFEKGLPEKIPYETIRKTFDEIKNFTKLSNKESVFHNKFYPDIMNALHELTWDETSLCVAAIPEPLIPRFKYYFSAPSWEVLYKPKIRSHLDVRPSDKENLDYQIWEYLKRFKILKKLASTPHDEAFPESPSKNVDTLYLGLPEALAEHIFNVFPEDVKVSYASFLSCPPWRPFSFLLPHMDCNLKKDPSLLKEAHRLIRAHLKIWNQNDYFEQLNGQGEQDWRDIRYQWSFFNNDLTYTKKIDPESAIELAKKHPKKRVILIEHPVYLKWYSLEDLEEICGHGPSPITPKEVFKHLCRLCDQLHNLRQKISHKTVDHLGFQREEIKEIQRQLQSRRSLLALQKTEILQPQENSESTL